MLSPYVPTRDEVKHLQKRLALTDDDVAAIDEKIAGGVEARAAFGALAFARLVDFASTEPELAYWFFAYLCSGAKCVVDAGEVGAGAVGAGAVDVRFEILDTKKRGS